MNINDCDISPCENNGTCIDLVNGFECNCPVGFSGDLCLTVDPVCNVTNPCLNGGTCHNVDESEDINSEFQLKRV